jgi:hypothetical protein
MMVANAAAATDRRFRLKIETKADTPLAIASPIDLFRRIYDRRFRGHFRRRSDDGFWLGRIDRRQRLAFAVLSDIKSTISGCPPLDSSGNEIRLFG